MPNEEKVELDTKNQDEESKETTEEESNEDESSSKTDEVDYKALLEAERERAEKAERALATKRFKKSEEKRSEEVHDEEEDDNKPLTKKELQDLLTRERQNTQKAFEESKATEIARKYTTSEEEASAALLYWKNRVIPTGNLEEDIMFAIGGLNNRKLQARNEELARALRSKDNIGRETATTFRDAAQGTVPRLSSGDSAAYKRAGFTYDTKDKLWKKILPNKKTLVKDPKSKQTYILR